MYLCTAEVYSGVTVHLWEWDGQRGALGPRGNDADEDESGCGGGARAGPRPWPLPCCLRLFFFSLP